MPIPVSLTLSWIRAPLSSESTCETPSTVSRPSMSFTAIDRRFVMIWQSRTGSPCTQGGTSEAASIRSSVPLPAACGPSTRVASFSMSSSWKSIDSRSNWPASIFGTSRTSLRIRRRPSADAFTTLIEDCCSSVDICMEEQLDHAQNAIHRRSDLVIHRSQKRTLRSREAHPHGDTALPLELELGHGARAFTNGLQKRSDASESISPKNTKTASAARRICPTSNGLRPPSRWCASSYWSS